MLWKMFPSLKVESGSGVVENVVKKIDVVKMLEVVGISWSELFGEFTMFCFERESC